MGWLAGHPRATLVLAGCAWAVCYAGSCWWFPFGRCWCCKGRGAHKRRDGKVFRDCRHLLGWGCGGSGRRLRIGRRVYNIIHKRVKHT